MIRRPNNFMHIKQIDEMSIYVSAILVLGLIGFMTVRGWINACFFIFLGIAILTLKNTVDHSKSSDNARWMIVIVVTLAMPVVAITFSQFGRQDWQINAYDGPSRMLFAIPIFLYFAHRKINFSMVVGLATPISLLATGLSIKFNPEVVMQWGGRYATSFVDPNSFGLYTVVLTSFCLFHVDTSLKSSKLWTGFQLFGLICGLYLIAGSGTRGSWLALPLILIVWFSANYRKMSLRFAWVILFVLIGAATLIELIFPNTAIRFMSGFSELHKWINHTDLDTSAGIRLSMWKISWDLFIHSPIYGYGDKGFFSHLGDAWVQKDATKIAIDTITCCGPHNEWLANLLRTGLMGVIAALGLLIVPLGIFSRYLKDPDQNTRLAAQLGVAYIVTLLVCSLSMEIFNLKYACTFYGLVIAGLLGQIASNNRVNHIQQSPKGT